jgi:hypothetical protein
MSDFQPQLYNLDATASTWLNPAKPPRKAGKP